jgi:AP-1 complex subunit beta-1
MGGGAHTGYVPPKQVWLTAQKGKGLEISGTWSLRNNVITMEMTFSNKAMQAMQGFGIQLNKNSFGMTSSQPLNIPLLNAGQTLDVALPMTCTGPVQKMDPLTNIQVAVKNSIDIFYFACIAPLHIFFSEEGAMEKKTFLNTWKDIPAANEIQHTIEGVECTSDGISSKMSQNNAFTVAKRTLEGQDMIYQSLKLTNGIWGLVEIKLSPGNPSITLSFKSRVMEIAPAVFSVYDAILHN